MVLSPSGSCPLAHTSAPLFPGATPGQLRSIFSPEAQFSLGHLEHNSDARCLGDLSQSPMLSLSQLWATGRPQQASPRQMAFEFGTGKLVCPARPAQQPASTTLLGESSELAEGRGMPAATLAMLPPGAVASVVWGRGRQAREDGRLGPSVRTSSC